MARILGEGEVTAGGETFRLRFDMNVLADLQETTGKTPVEIMSGLQDNSGSVVLLRTVCHAMLKRHHPEAPIEVAGDILSENMESLMAIISAAMPAQAQGDPGNAGAKAGQPH
jgi:hypothetical protein